MTLDMRLAYRIATQQCCLIQPLECVASEELAALIRVQRNVIARSPKFILDNIADYLATHGRVEWGCREHIPNWAPPFKASYIYGPGYLAFATIEQRGIMDPLFILGLGLSFCHCKNVVRAEQAVDRGERFHRRTNTPVYLFHTLNIDPMKEVLRREGRSDDVGVGKALHICRGHFATYTPRLAAIRQIRRHVLAAGPRARVRGEARRSATGAARMALKAIPGSVPGHGAGGGHDASHGTGYGHGHDGDHGHDTSSHTPAHPGGKTQTTTSATMRVVVTGMGTKE